MFPVGYNPDDTDFDTIGKTGGEKEHTLTTEEIPSHSHRSALGYAKFNLPSGNANVFVSQYAYNNGSYYYTTSNGLQSAWVGGSQAHNNVPPFQVVAYWKRVA